MAAEQEAYKAAPNVALIHCTVQKRRKPEVFPTSAYFRYPDDYLQDDGRSGYFRTGGGFHSVGM